MSESASYRGITINIDDLGKRFNREWIFRNLTYSFEPGQMYAVTGPNGSGKSTLMQILWGQSLPSAGTISYSESGSDIPAEEIFRRVSIATPYMDLIEELTLEEHIDFHCRLKPLRAGITRDELIERMYLSSSRKKQIGVFSSGMRQRLKIGLALFSQADIVFLDEPGTNLDKQAFSWYMLQITDTLSHSSIIVASNNPDEYKGASAALNIMDYK